MEKKFTINSEQEVADEEMLKLIEQGDQQALEKMINKYEELVKMKASKFFMYGAEKNDIIQEGMIGLYKAIRDFNKQKNITFRTFANICIERQLITAIKSANRQKHMLLNSAISIDSNVGTEEENYRERIELIKSNYIEDPSEAIVKSEYYMNIYNAIDQKLSNHEKEVLIQYQKGKSYAEIAKALDCKPKSVDTAMTRIRKKANKIKEEFNQKDNF
ncbi:MAG: sigma-70 family RNA polymerase sigma factor [Clostridia bacterium]|nr:sigma-70 family RNA polymerase sigma factor [Clostridia bacterium]